MRLCDAGRQSSTDSMNSDAQDHDSAAVKEVLCSYFNMPSDTSHLAIQEKRFLGLGGPQFRYYYFTLTDGKRTCRAFGKTTLHHDREYRALQYLTKTVPEQYRNTSRPIASLRQAGNSLLLLEYLEGYSSALSMVNSLRLFPKRALNIIGLGKHIIDKIFDLQEHSPVIYTPLSLKDTDEIPCQPVPISIFEELRRIKSLSIETKEALRTRINALLSNQTLVRRGLIHGQLGMRNILVNHSNVLFIDWEYMQSAAFCLFDPCYMAIMLLMRAVQLLISSSKLDIINDDLFERIRVREESLAAEANRRFVNDALWFAKCLSMVDTLYEYETGESSRLKAVVGQKHRKIRYLACHIEKDAANGAGCEGSRL